MKFAQAVLPLLLSTGVLASPTPSLEKRATTICGSWDSVKTGTYSVNQNLWGKASASSGSQCSTVTSDNGGTLVWSTSFSWAGGKNSVKSYANAQLDLTSKKISAISSIPTTWHWSFTGTSGLVADVSYDMFTSSSAGGSHNYEIMVWLAAIGGAGPISSSGSPIATPTIGGVSWKLYKGPNGSFTVYSFVATSQQTNYSGDLKAFYTYLINSQGYPSSQYLTYIGAGTEPFVASNAKLSTSAYKVVVN